MKTKFEGVGEAKAESLQPTDNWSGPFMSYDPQRLFEHNEYVWYGYYAPMISDPSTLVAASNSFVKQ